MYGHKHIEAAAAQTGCDYGAALGAAYQHEATAKLGTKRGGLEIALDGIGGSLDRLQSSLEALGERMNTVLRPSIPTPVGSARDAGITPATCPAAGYAENLRSRIDGLQAKVLDLLDRLDA